MADGHERLGFPRQQLFEPQDALEVEVVGGLVEQEQLGLVNQLGGNGEPLLPAPGKDGGLRIRIVETGFPHHDGHAGVDLMRIEMLSLERRLQHLLDGEIGIELRILGHEAETEALARGPGSGARLFKAGEDPQQRGLSGTIRTDEADVVSLEYPEREAFEQRGGTERLPQILTTQQQLSHYSRSQLSLWPLDRGA